MTDFGLIVERLGECDRHVNRIMTRHRYLCPKCGRECDAKYHYVKGKCISCSDIEIDCPVCGKIMVETQRNGKKMTTTIKGTREKCLIRSNVAALQRKLQQKKFTDIDELVDICDRIAAEARYGEVVVDLVSLYCTEMQALLDHCKANSGDKIVCMCEHTLDCNDIGKLELLDIMREVYDYITENKVMVPRPLFLRIDAEKSMLEYAYDRLFYDADEFMWHFDWCAEDYFSLPNEEFLRFPFTPHIAYQYATKIGESEREQKLIRKYSRLDRKSIEESVARGARLDNRIAETYVVMIDQTSEDKMKVVEKLDRNMTKMREDPCYVAFATGYSAYCLFNSIAKEVTKTAVDNTDSALRNRIVRYANKCIEAAEQLDDVSGIAFFLTLSYILRGMFTDRGEDLERGVDYAILFSNHNLIGGIWLEELSTCVNDYFDEEDSLSIRYNRNTPSWLSSFPFKFPKF